MKEWVCVGHKPTRWALGKVDKKEQRVSEIVAYAQRLKDGSWNWYTLGRNAMFGNEPSADEAMKAATVAFDRLGESEEL